MHLVTVSELRQLMQREYNKIVLVDVRTAAEYNAYHIENAINIPSSLICETEYGNFAVLNKFKNISSYGFKIILYCKCGNRSMRCVKILRENGVECLSLHGGTDKYGTKAENSV